MRKLQHLSPTSIGLWDSNPEEFYLQYLSENRPDKIPQTQPMSVGSAFDAYIKNFLYERLIGKNPKFDLITLFEAQVEYQNRDFAWEAGKYIFSAYRDAGCIGDLLIELQGAVGVPKFELEIKGVINGFREGITRDLGVILLGKPDVFYINNAGAHVILDWKVNGYCSKYPVSPMAGYVRLREGRINKGQHKDAQIMMHKGVMINVAKSLDGDWGRQLSIYAWLCGMEIGDDFIAAIDQVVCKPNPNGPVNLRFADHRMRINQTFQWNVFAQAQMLWEIVQSDHVFRNMTKEESQERCLLLDTIASGRDWINEVARR